MKDENIIVYSLTLFTFAVIFGLCYLRYKFTFFERHKRHKIVATSSIPSFPFGNVKDVVFQNVTLFMHLWKHYNKFRGKKCRVGGFYFFLTPCVLLTDEEITKQVIEEQEYFLNIYPRSDNRSVSEPLLDIIFEHIFASCTALQKHCADLSNPINLTKLFKQNLEIIEIPEVRAWINSTRKFTDLLPIPYKLFRTQKYPSYLLTVIEKYLDENSTKNENAVVKHLKEYKVPDEHIAEIILDLAKNLGCSINILLLALYELSLNEEIQDDLRGEILRFQKTKSSRATILEDLNSLSYLETVASETLRKYPVNPLIQKICKKEFVYNNVIFPEDLPIFISTFGIHHDPQIYTNPELFDPDRFSEENEKYIDAAMYLPFGFRRKDEFGSKFTKLILKSGLFCLLSTFRISLAKISVRPLTFAEDIFELKLKDDLFFKLEPIF